MKDAKERGAKWFAAAFLTVLFLFSGFNFVLNHETVAEELREIHWKWEDAAENLQETENILNEELLFHYPLIDAYGAIQVAMGKHEENSFDAVKDKNGFLYNGNFWSGFGDDPRELAARARRLELQLESQGTSFGVVLFPQNFPEPDAEYYGIPYDDFSHNAEMFASWARYYGVPLLDLSDNWKENGLTQEEAFFRTDHHWTPLAAFYGYCAIMDWMQQTLGASFPQKVRLCNLDNYNIETYANVMFGSHGRETGLIFAGGPEDYTLVYPKTEGNYRLKEGTIDDYEVHEGGFSDALLWTDYDLDSYDDWYNAEVENTYLYSGVSEYASIENLNNPTGKKILLLRDSYATPVGAFLAQSFAQVDMLWSGEYTEEELEEFLQDNHYDYVLLSLYQTNLSYTFFPFGIEE